MNKIRFIINNFTDSATLTADPVMDANLPVDNLKDPTRSKVTRSIDDSDQIIRGILSGTQDVSAIVLGRHNFAIDMQYKISLYNNNSLDTTYSVTGGTETTNDEFYIDGDYTHIYSEIVTFDVFGDTSYIDTCVGGNNGIDPIQDTFYIATDKTSIYVADTKINYIGDTDDAANRVYTVISSTYNSPNTEIIVAEEVSSANFDGILEPYANYSVNTGGSILNSTAYAVTGGVDNIDPTKDIFYVAGDQSTIFSRASTMVCTGDSNPTTNIVYTISSVAYNGAFSRTEITVDDNINSHVFDGSLTPVYTTIPVTTNTLPSPNFDGSILPDFLVWNSGILDVTEDTVGSDIWKWGEFLWGTEAWGAEKEVLEFEPPANLVTWISTAQTNIRGFKIELYKADSNINYFEIGRLFVGEYIQPTYNIGYGHSLSWEESTKQYRTDAGTLRSDISIPYRKFEFNIGTITEDDRILLQQELRNAGLRKDIFISLFPEDITLDKKIDYSGIVKLTKVPKFTEFTQNYYKSKYVMEEI
jgi:hypothetical protein